MERRYRAKGNISFFEGRRVSSYRYFFSSLALSIRFILLFSVFSGREDYNQRAHKDAFTVLFSPPVLVDFFDFFFSNDEREDKLVGKSSRCSRIHRPERVRRVALEGWTLEVASRRGDKARGKRDKRPGKEDT